MHCMLAAYRSMLAYFLHRDFSWKELENLTGYKNGIAAWTVKPLVELQEMGLDIRMIEPFDYRNYLKEGEAYLHKIYKHEEVKWILENTNIREVKPFIPRFLSRIKYERRTPTLEDIDEMLADGRLVFVTVNSRILNDREGFSSHALLVLDRNGNDYIAHDSGGKNVKPKASRRISREKIFEAMGGKKNTAEVTGFKLATSQKGKRLDKYVAEQFAGLSRAYAAKLIEHGKVKINARAINKAGYKLHGTDAVDIDYDPKELKQIPHIELPILYEDNDCVVINKPVGVLTHSKGSHNSEATVATFLRSHLQNSQNPTLLKVRPFDGKVGVSDRDGIVHRLDRATSGVMICAKTPEALSWLQKQFSQRKVKKSYMAIVAGKVDPEHAVIDMPIERNPKAPATFRVGPNGKSASTEYFVENFNGQYSLVKLTPLTGRTHQLRVHLKQIDHPIVGDTFYDGETTDRLYLHALSLEITLPSRERKTFIAPLPSEFERKMEQNRA